MEYMALAILGRVTRSKQITDGVEYGGGTDPTKWMTYTYNLSGALIEQQYPSGRVVKNTLSNDGSLQQVQSRRASDTFRNYANAFTYNAAGAVSALRLGNGKWETTQFNSRLQPTQIGLGASASSQNLLRVNYTYNSSGNADNNGNVLSQTITVPTVGANAGFTANQTYTYDSLNRIKDAVEVIGTETWRQTFLYDRYGNRTFDTTANRTTTIPAGCSTAVCNPSVDAATNKLIGYQFDSSGNTKVDANGQGFTYDSENKQVEVRDASSAVLGQYIYNGDGLRIKKIVPSTGETTVFIYDASNKLVAEYSTVVESSATAKISYLTNDHLGSPRITTDAVGQVISRRDFRPFGEEIVRTNYGSDSIRQKFTGYERDSETDLDFAQARYFNSGIGRFSSPDSFTNDTRVGDPQSWNLYVYVRNNPLNLIDTTGTKATITYHYDPDTNTTTIKIKASFAVYGAQGQNVVQEDLNAYAKLIKDGIEGNFNQQFKVDGKNFVMSADISVSVAGSEEAAIASGADNIAELGYQDLSDSEGDASASAYRVEGEAFDRMVASIAPGGPGGLSSGLYGGLFAHEFGAHLMSGYHSDDPESLFCGENCTNDRFLQDDFERIFASNDPNFTGPPPNSRIIQVGVITNASLAIGTGKNFSGVLTTNKGGGVETRRANRTVPTNPNNWVKAVKK